MYHVFYGNDTTRVRSEAHDLIDQSGAAIERIDAENFLPGILSDMAGATSLFGLETIYLIDTPSQQKDFFADVIENLPLLAESLNMFVIVEEALLAPEKKQFTKYAASIKEFKKPAAERFNAFGLADSLAKKDKRLLWVQLMEAKHSGLSAEELIGTLWWQLKSLRLAHLTSSASEAGMKDFPYNKAKRSLANFKSGELETLSSRLLALYHDGHSGKTDIDLALEKWVLTI